MEILGIPHIAMAVIIAVAGTVLYHLRNWPEGKYDVRKIVDARIAIFTTAVAGAYASIPTILTQAPTHDLQLLAVIGQIGAVAGIGYGAKVVNDKRVARKTRQQTEALTSMDMRRPDGNAGRKVHTETDGRGKQQSTAAPLIGPPDSWFQTSLKHKKGKGAVLPYGTAYLWIGIKDAKTFVSATLSDSLDNIIQIDQTQELDKTNGVATLRFEMFARDGTPLPRGAYKIKAAGDRGTSYTIGTGVEFSII